MSSNIPKTLKDARGYERTGFERFHSLSEGIHPTLDHAAKPASFLPVKLKDEFRNEWWVVLAGTIVSMNRSLASTPRIVPANGGAAQNLVYTSDDVNYTTDIDSADLTNPALVSAAGTSIAQIPANKPIGWAWHHYYSSSIEERLINYDIQPFVSLLCDYEIEIPLLASGDQGFEGGDLVKPSVQGTEMGIPHLWVNGVDSAEQICGRILFRDAIPTGTASRSRIDLQKPVRGLGLSGRENDGRPRHLDAYLYGSSTTKASYYVRLNIALC